MIKRSLLRAAALLIGTLLLLPMIYFGGLLVAHDFSPDFLAIDSCLDAGGRWDYAHRRCVRT